MNNIHNSSNSWKDNILGALTDSAIYTYEFDVTTGIVANDIIGKDGTNYTHAMGMKSPAIFDELIKNSLADEMRCSLSSVKGFDDFNRATLLSAFEKGISSVDIEFHYTKDDDYHRITYALSKDSLTGHIMAYVVCYDISNIKHHDIQLAQERENAKKKVEAALEAAERANEARELFLSRMSHDVRTPLNVVSGMLEIIRTNMDDKNVISNSVEKIEEASSRLLSLIDDILNMSKMVSGELIIENNPFDFSELVGEFVKTSKAAAENAELEFEANIISEGPRFLLGSPAYLKQVLNIILSNAVKYNKKNGKIKADFKHIASTDKLAVYEMKISDTGIGMTDKFVEENLFGTFMQAENHARTSFKGSGLGLAMAHEIIHKMGGSIRVESEPNVGTTVSIQIPFEIDVKAVTASKVETIDLTGKKVLLVDDNDINLDVARFMLGKLGLTVVQASDGQEAYEVFQNSKPGDFDIILMDLMMPVMDGYTAAKTIRSMDRADAKEVPIVAMSANVFDEDVNNCIAAGMNGHLAKPIDRKKLQKALLKYIK